METDCGSQALPTAPEFLRTSGHLLFVADLSGGLLTYTLLQPATPALLSRFTPSAGIADVAIDGTLALMAAVDKGLIVANVTNPAQPVLIAQVDLPPYEVRAVAQTTSVSLTGSIAYLGSAFGDGIIYGFDYRQPRYPRLISMSPEGGYINTAILTLLANGSDLFVGGFFGEIPFLQLDISRPRNVITTFQQPAALGGGVMVSNAPGAQGDKRPFGPGLKWTKRFQFDKMASPRPTSTMFRRPTPSLRVH